MDHLKLIAEYALKMSSSDFFLKLNETLSVEESERIDSVVARRLKGEPLQYITGVQGFWNSTLKVGPGVLIPRKETEHLVESILEQINEIKKVAELGAGSGNIGISVLQNKPKIQWVGFEKNPDSIPYLEENIRSNLNMAHQYQVVQGDFFEKVNDYAFYDAVVSNPPYLSAIEYLETPLEVKQEPEMALKSGESGFECIEKLINVAYQVLRNEGLFFAEVGWGQAEKTEALLLASGFRFVWIKNDLAKIPRVICARK